MARFATASAATPSGSPRRPVLDELDADHQPGPADVADRRVVRHQLAQAAAELGPAGAGVLDQPLVADRLEHGDAGGAGDRVAAVRRAVRAATPALAELAPGHDRRQREPVGDRLGHAHDVGDDPRVLERPHLARPAVARLHLVGDQQDPVLVAQRAQRAHERDRRRVVAALALDRLDEDRGDLRGGDDRGQQRPQDREARRRGGRLVAVELGVGGRVRREVDARQERLVAGPVVEAGRRHARRTERPAVERAAERDDPGPARDPAGELERAVDRLRARVEEQDRVERVGERAGEHPGQLDGRLREADRVDGTRQPVDLGVDGGGDPGMGVAQRGDRDPVREVEVLPPGRVVQPVADAVRPAPVDVAADDRRHVGARERGQVECGGILGGAHRPSIGRVSARSGRVADRRRRRWRR